MIARHITPFLVAAFAVAVGLATPASAQVFRICGDVDGNRTVSVTDGVQVLRAAAGLQNNCTQDLCDADVNGTIGVTDGVIILRKAAGLSVRDNCIASTGSVNSQVEHLILRTEPLFTDVLGTIVLRRNVLVDQSFPCRNVADDGAYEVTVSDGVVDGSFSECLFANGVGGTLVDGSADNAGDNPALTITLTDQFSEETIDFEGGLIGVDTESGVKYSGNIDAAPSFERFETDAFLLIFNNFEVQDPDLPPIGVVTFELNPDSAVPGVDRVRMFFDGSNLARVQVELENGDVEVGAFDVDSNNFF